MLGDLAMDPEEHGSGFGGEEGSPQRAAHPLDADSGDVFDPSHGGILTGHEA